MRGFIYVLKFELKKQKLWAIALAMEQSAQKALWIRLRLLRKSTEGCNQKFFLGKLKLIDLLKALTFLQDFANLNMLYTLQAGGRFI